MNRGWPADGEAVENSPESNSERPQDRVAFQFGLGRLFVLMAVCAGVLAVVNTMKAPVLFRLGVALYLMLLAAYVILRVPHIYRICRRIHRRRQELEAVLAQAAAVAKEAKDASGDERPKTPTMSDRPDLGHPDN